MTRRMGALFLVCAFVALGTSGCTRGDQARKDLAAIIAKTQQLSGEYVYDDRSAGVDTQVKAIVADDYEYKSEVIVNGQPKVDEVVADDSIADLFVDPNAVPLLARRTSEGKLQSPPADDVAVLPSSGISVIDALTTQRWVVDPSGAPDVFLNSGKHPIGQDPVYDARNVFAYTTQALFAARSVKKYDSESIDPVFKSKDDPFPQPKHGAPLVRYDLEPQNVPRKNSLASGVNQAVPDVPNFRRMVVYVQNGLVVRIMEDTTLDWRLDDLKKNYSLTLSGTPDQQAVAALVGINAVRQGQGNDPIRPRVLDFNFINPGRHFDVALPTTAVFGPLHLLVNRGAGGTTATVPVGTASPASAPVGASAPADTRGSTTVPAAGSGTSTSAPDTSLPMTVTPSTSPA